MSESVTNAPQHAGSHDPHVNYMAKFYWLVGLTTAEVIVAFTLDGAPRLALLAFLSVWKAAIVLQYFMHMKTENLALKLAMCFPLALIFVLVTLFLADGVFFGYSSFPG